MKPFLLYGGQKTSITYDWEKDSYVLRSPGKRLEIEHRRLTAFGIYPRNVELKDEWVIRVTNAIEDYEKHYNVKTKGVTEE